MAHQFGAAEYYHKAAHNRKSAVRGTLGDFTGYSDLKGNRTEEASVTGPIHRNGVENKTRQFPPPPPPLSPRV